MSKGILNIDENDELSFVSIFREYLVSLVTAPQKQWLYFTSTVAVKMSKGILMKMVKVCLIVDEYNW